ncbi:ATP-binding cassette sub- G member 2, partial [Borealophlyctis nickersoniae]
RTAEVKCTSAARIADLHRAWTEKWKEQQSAAQPTVAVTAAQPTVAVTAAEANTVVVTVEDVKKPEAHAPAEYEWKRNGWFTEFWILLGRDSKTVVRDPLTIFGIFGMTTVLLLFWGFVWYHLGLDATGVQNRSGGINFLVTANFFATSMAVVIKLPVRRPHLKRELAAGTYRMSTGFATLFLTMLAVTSIMMMIMAVPGYWMLDLRPGASHYFIYLGVLAVHNLTGAAFGMMLGAMLPTVELTGIVGAMCTTIFMIFSGLVVNLDTVTPVLRWMQWVSPIAYAHKSLMQNELADRPLDCHPETSVVPCFATGNQFLTANRWSMRGRVKVH